jgi:hypothetical protein
MIKHSRPVRLAFMVALVVCALVAVCTGSIGGGVLVAAAVLTVKDYEEILSQIFDVADEAGQSKDDMRAALDEITDLADPEVELERADDGTWSVSTNEASGDGEADEDDEQDD